MIKRSENHEALISRADKKPHLYISFRGNGIIYRQLIGDYLFNSVRRMDRIWAKDLSKRVNKNIKAGV